MVIIAWLTWEASNFHQGESGKERNEMQLGILLEWSIPTSEDRLLKNASYYFEWLMWCPPTSQSPCSKKCRAQPNIMLVQLLFCYDMMRMHFLASIVLKRGCPAVSISTSLCPNLSQPFSYNSQPKIHWSHIIRYNSLKNHKWQKSYHLIV